MANMGPGKYDDAATQARELTNALGVVLMVLQGDQGNGFSVQIPSQYITTLPEVMRSVADGIEASLHGNQAPPPAQPCDLEAKAIEYAPAMQDLIAANPVVVAIPAPDTMSIIGLLQLAMRHPDVGESAPAAGAVEFIKRVRLQLIAINPLLGNMVDDGWVNYQVEEGN